MEIEMVDPKIKYYNNGQKQSEEWFLDGKYHRVDGPAKQYWFDDGRIHYEEWCLNGQKILIYILNYIIHGQLKEKYYGD